MSASSWGMRLPFVQQISSSPSTLVFQPCPCGPGILDVKLPDKLSSIWALDNLLFSHAFSDFLDKVEEGSCQHHCSLSVPLLALHWISINFSYLRELMSPNLLPYIRHVNFSRSLNTLSSMSTLDPRAWNVGRNSGCFLRSVSGFTFPLLTKALVVSQPVNACRATRARLISSPRSLATAWTFTSRRLSPVPVSNSTVWFIWRTNLRSKMNTSVSGDLTSITELSGEFAATSLQCKIILVSASSCEEHSFSPSSVTSFFPSDTF